MFIFGGYDGSMPPERDEADKRLDGIEQMLTQLHAELAEVSAQLRVASEQLRDIRTLRKPPEDPQRQWPRCSACGSWGTIKIGEGVHDEYFLCVDCQSAEMDTDLPDANTG
jgi:hypothetical protein